MKGVTMLKLCPVYSDMVVLHRCWSGAIPVDISNLEVWNSGRWVQLQCSLIPQKTLSWPFTNSNLWNLISPFPHTLKNAGVGKEMV